MKIGMAIAKMKLCNIVGRLKDFDTVVRSCCLQGDFHPEQSTLALDNVEEFLPIEEYNPYTKTLQTAVDVGVHSDIALEYRPFDKLGLSDEELADALKKTESEVNALNGRVRTLSDDIARMEQGLTQLSHLAGLEISLDDIFGCKFFRFRFGRLPKESLPKLEVCDERDSVFFFPLEEDKDTYWGFYVVLAKDCEKIDELFGSLYFEYINLLEEAHGLPRDAMTTVRKGLAEKAQALEGAKSEVAVYWKEHREAFLTQYSKIKYLSDSFELRRYAAKCGDNFYVFGWVPEKDAAAFAAQFQKLQGVDCVIENTEEAGDIAPPTKLVNSAAARPFENFVEMYSLPLYNEIDPTPFMALGYAAMFGIMFGDLGQGFLILLVALFMKFKKKMFLGDIMIRCSLFSMLFGFLYNSVFGYDSVLPFTILPVHKNEYVQAVLLLAVGFGALVILFCMILNIVNGVRQKNPEKIFFSQNGLAGMVFYVAVLGALLLLMYFKVNLLNPVYILLLIVLPLVLILLKEPLGRLAARKKDWMPEKKGEYLMLSSFEMIEVLLAFLSNTISFIRVGAFILSHAAMMLAVFTIGSMTGNTNNPVVLVIGNAFVIGLEGLIVGIQVLRLQFYEVFSRFYDGGGKPFEPVRIKYDI